MVSIRDIQYGCVKWVDANRNILIHVRDEAHRFALAYQRIYLLCTKIILNKSI